MNLTASLANPSSEVAWRSESKHRFGAVERPGCARSVLHSEGTPEGTPHAANGTAAHSAHCAKRARSI